MINTQTLICRWKYTVDGAQTENAMFPFKYLLVCLIINLCLIFSCNLYAALKLSSENSELGVRKRAVALSLHFEFGSAKMTQDLIDQITPVGEALNSEELQDYKFIVEGHVSENDNLSTNYSLRLSQERAETVAHYLRNIYEVKNRLVIFGEGSRAPLDKDLANSAINNRVVFHTLPNAAPTETQPFSLNHIVKANRDYSFSSLSNFDLRKSDLANTRLIEIDLSNSDLRGASFVGSNLFQANMHNTLLIESNLSGADLFAANLSEANLTNTNLAGASLEEANLAKSLIRGTDLSHTNVTKAIFTDSVFEPISVPQANTLHDVIGFETLKWVDSPRGLILLRDTLRKAGLKNKEREVTYSIRKSASEKKNIVIASFEKIAFELTSLWGLSPTRPLKILGFLIPIFAFIYGIELKLNRSCTRVWKVVEEVPGKTLISSLNLHSYFQILYWSLFLSVLAAFRIGWKEVNIGNWISRLTMTPISLETIGPIRIITGIQSLISIYLVVLWLLCTVGRPFN